MNIRAIGFLGMSALFGWGTPVMLFSAEDIAVKITPYLAGIRVKHGDQEIAIIRNQNEDNQINSLYAKTSRRCPPFCVTPIKAHPQVDTIGELEIIDYLKRINEGDDSLLLIDSRTQDWVTQGTIPGSIHIPWVKLSPKESADPKKCYEKWLRSEPCQASEVEERDNILTGVLKAKKLADKTWDFSEAKTVALFCNGLWCSQSSTNIHSLLNLGYPPEKIKWYRGGMQDWEVLGLTVAGKPIASY